MYAFNVLAVIIFQSHDASGSFGQKKAAHRVRYILPVQGKIAISQFIQFITGNVNVWGLGLNPPF